MSQVASPNTLRGLSLVNSWGFETRKWNKRTVLLSQVILIIQPGAKGAKLKANKEGVLTYQPKRAMPKFVIKEFLALRILVGGWATPLKNISQLG